MAFNPDAARHLAERPIAVAANLAEFPDRGRYAGNGMREMTVVQPYVIRYRASRGGVHPAHPT